MSSYTGLFNKRALLFLSLWYFFSGCTLFLNKWIMAGGGDATLLGTSQMLSTLVLGFVQMHVPCGMQSGPIGRRTPYKHLFVVGTMRFATVLLGLISLNYIPVSFTESIKSSAPIFTVLISYFLIGERTDIRTIATLIPIMTGLALASYGEVDFNFTGFWTALATNVTECIQNVYSKYLISGVEGCSPAQLQFYTSLSSMLVQIPISYILVEDWAFHELYLLNGIFFHFQSISSYVLMDYISPVTHSVANTVKRALLIWFSILLFHNQVTWTGGGGTMVMFTGVWLYNKVRSREEGTPQQQQQLLRT